MISDVARKYSDKNIDKLKPVVKKWFDEHVKEIMDNPGKYQTAIDKLKHNIKYNSDYNEYFCYSALLKTISKDDQDQDLDDIITYLLRKQVSYPYGGVLDVFKFNYKITDKNHVLNGCRIVLFCDDNKTLRFKLCYSDETAAEKCNIV